MMLTPIKLILTRLCAVMVLGIWAGSSSAQSDFTIRTPSGQRLFAEPQYWLNMTPDVRLPIRERLLDPQTGITAWAPPPSKRSGLTPWIGMGFEVNNTGGVSDSVFTITPGFRYRYDTPRLSFAAEYAVEAALHLERSNLSRALQGHGGFARLAYALDERSHLTFHNIFSDTRNVRDAPLLGPLSNGIRLVSNTFVAGYSFSPSRRSKLDITWTNSANLVGTPVRPNIHENTLAGRYQYALSETTGIATALSAGWINMGFGNSASRLSADVTYTHDFGPHLAASGTIGVLHTSARRGTTIPRLGATLVHANRFARYELAASRDIIAIPGLRNLARSDEITGKALMRLKPGLILDMSLGYQRLGIYNAAATKSSVVSASGKLSYALRRDVWIWAQLEVSRESTGPTSQNNNRLIIGFSRNLSD